jgi:hypothetical protein
MRVLPPLAWKHTDSSSQIRDCTLAQIHLHRLIDVTGGVLGDTHSWGEGLVIMLYMLSIKIWTWQKSVKTINK